jgi:hypothetical protein
LDASNISELVQQSSSNQGDFNGYNELNSGVLKFVLAEDKLNSIEADLLSSSVECL